MVLPIRKAALLTALAVVGLVLFPAGTGPFTATHGPLTAVSVVGHTILEFVLICILPATTVIIHVKSCARQQIGVVPVNRPDRTPIPALRC